MFNWAVLAAYLAVTSTAVTPDQLSTSAPKELGQRLLGPTRQPIVEAFLYGEALGPPPPPGAPVATRVMLYEQARKSSEPDFCEKIRYLVQLHPVARDRNDKLPPASADLITPSTLYRLQTTDGSGSVCEGHGQDFLSIDDQHASAVFSVIRQLAMTQQEIRQNKPVELSGSVDDEYGRQGYPAAGFSGPITDWKIAFQNFPTTKISRYFLGETAEGETFSFQAAEWTIELTISHGYDGIGKVALRRFIPSPP